MSAWRICEEELLKLPDNNKFSFNHCSKFSSTFVFDGKYFNVKGYETDMAILWGIDYFKHDIPVFTLAPSENYQAWARYFSFFRILLIFPQLLICDDNVNLKMAARFCFPAVKIQTCYNHFKENIRRDLRVRSDNTYRPFIRRIESALKNKVSNEVFNRWMYSLYQDYKNDPVCLSVMANIEKYRTELFAYRGIPQSPVTTNLIEGFNSHLEARLVSLRSFNSPHHARLWFNGYVLKRRFTRYSDCKGKFKKLNGKRGVDMTKKPDVDLPPLF